MPTDYWILYQGEVMDSGFGDPGEIIWGDPLTNDKGELIWFSKFSEADLSVKALQEREDKDFMRDGYKGPYSGDFSDEFKTEHIVVPSTPETDAKDILSIVKAMSKDERESRF